VFVFTVGVRRFGFTNPILIGDDNGIIAGHGRVEAAKLLGMESVPTLRLSHLDAAQRRAYVIADNKLALNAGWDRELLAMELQALIDMEFDVDVTGFSLAEIDLVLDDARAPSPDPDQAADNIIPPLANAVSAVTRCGDLWLLGPHRLVCGDPRKLETFDRLLGGERADLVFTVEMSADIFPSSSSARPANSSGSTLQRLPASTEERGSCLAMRGRHGEGRWSPPRRQHRLSLTC
jgi:hypothetical protein